MGRFAIEKKEYKTQSHNTNVDIEVWREYYRDVLLDFNEAKHQYPFINLTILPTIKPQLATIRVVAVNKHLIDMVGGIESDFLGDYSKELYFVVPIDYKEAGCNVYGAKWVDVSKLQNKDIHFFHKDGRLIRTKYGMQICVGTPESFSLMENVILENIRTAENMLIAYERVMSGASDKIEMIAYAHGETGRRQFLNNKKRYIPERNR